MRPDSIDQAPDALDPRAVRRAFARAARTYDSAAVLQREVGARMAERLDLVRIAPAAILDAGCGTGDALPALAKRYPSARCIALDIAHAMVEHAKERHGARRSALARVASVLRGEVNDPSFGGRVRSFVGLGSKIREKLGLVAKSVREGSLR